MVVPSRAMPTHKDLPYRIAVLVFLENAAGEHLLIHRAKPPNLGAWSPIGGKLEMASGESPFECAVRETREEAGFGPLIRIYPTGSPCSSFLRTPQASICSSTARSPRTSARGARSGASRGG